MVMVEVWLSAPMFLVADLPGPGAFVLDGAEGHHAATVARLRVGAELVVCDGRGGTASAVVTAVGRGTLDLLVGVAGREPAADPRLVVVQAIAKGDRGELAVQAMTEVGVDGVVPWAASRSVVQWAGERGSRARQRWVDTAREAAKQSRRTWLPEVGDAESTKQVAQRLADCACALVLHEEAVAPLTRVALPATGEIVLVVGPEGGIAEAERAAFEAVGGRLVRLGGTVLRTSTAGVAALAVLNGRLGRW